MKIYITGQITDQPYDGCYSPEDLKKALEGIDENEPLEVEITSEGGSVFAGIQMATMLARWKGKVTTHAVGFVASIATVILMAGDDVVVDSNCFCLIHLPWSYVQGNADDLQKEIDALEKCKRAMMSFYMKHAKVSEEEIESALKDETWLLGDEFATMFNVQILENDETLNIAAKYDLSKYKNIPEELKMKAEIDNTQHNEDTTPSPETTTQDMVVQDEVIDEKNDETPEDVSEKSETQEEEKPEEEEPTMDELKEALEKANERIAELEKQLAECGGGDEEKEENAETITKAECEKRVSGMQSTMQAKVNDLNAKMNDFQNQLMAKNEELTQAKAEITSLKDSLHNTSEELSRMASAYEEKNKALERLNSGVNAHAEELPTMEEGLKKCSSPEAKVAFLKSGKYRR